MNVLILGSEGFIGSELVQALFYSRGFLDKLYITGIDICSNPLLNDIRKHSSAFYSYVRDDLRDTNLSMHIDFPDLIINAAATVGVDKVKDNPLFASQNNMSITTNLIDYLIDCKKIRHNYNPYVIFCSSSEVYGNNTKCDPTDYEFNLFPDNERGIYAISKLHEESMYNQLKYYGFSNVLILRLFNIVGETQSKNFAINKMIDSIVRTGRVNVDMNTSRRYCHVDFLSSFICNFVKDIVPYEKDFYGTINFGTRFNENYIKTPDLVYLIASSLKRNGINISNTRYNMNISTIDNITDRDFDYRLARGMSSVTNILDVIEHSKAFDSTINSIVERCVKYYLEKNK